jgi:hypothetical protein
MSFINQLGRIARSVTVKKPTSSKIAWPPVVRDWKRILLGFVLATGMVFILEGYLFIQINQEDALTVHNSSSPKAETINRTLLLKTIQEFQAKKEYLDTLRQSSQRIVDPSL